jgi:hypothetical protein
MVFIDSLTRTDMWWPTRSLPHNASMHRDTDSVAGAPLEYGVSPEKDCRPGITSSLNLFQNRLTFIFDPEWGYPWFWA